MLNTGNFFGHEELAGNYILETYNTPKTYF